MQWLNQQNATIDVFSFSDGKMPLVDVICTMSTWGVYTIAWWQQETECEENKT